MGKSSQMMPVMVMFRTVCKKYYVNKATTIQLVGLKPKLQDIQCFGTDGEKALEDAQFKYATHLRSFLHRVQAV